jgi:uncharacterized pyridoxal phosphate-containing UPF0001 family protein
MSRASSICELIWAVMGGILTRKIRSIAAAVAAWIAISPLLTITLLTAVTRRSKTASIASTLEVVLKLEKIHAGEVVLTLVATITTLTIAWLTSGKPALTSIARLLTVTS